MRLFAVGGLSRTLQGGIMMVATLTIVGRSEIADRNQSWRQRIRPPPDQPGKKVASTAAIMLGDVNVMLDEVK